MIRLRVRGFDLEVIKPKLWEGAVLLLIGIIVWTLFSYVFR
ncbi:MAG: hypothetical protein WAM56_13570 [Acidobacteriaceae bacterium]